MHRVPQKIVRTGRKRWENRKVGKEIVYRTEDIGHGGAVKKKN
jgi:hypothetical protein